MSAARAFCWGLAALLALGMAGYAITQLVVGARMYPEPLRASFLARPWGIIPHAACGAVALLLGPWQFLPASYRRRPALHRSLGWTFLAAALGTGVAGLSMSFYAYAGGWARAGFAGMAIATILCPLVGLRAIRRHDEVRHRAWMLRAFAMVFAAVTFRLWIPILVAALGDFERAYPWVAWAAWVPNLLWVQLWLRWFPTPQ